MNAWGDVDCSRVFPHDLLRLDSEDSFVSDASSEHPWVRKVLAETRTVVVRRGASTAGLIPVGVRGRSRSLRCAGFVSAHSVLQTITSLRCVDPVPIGVISVSVHFVAVKAEIRNRINV